MEQGRMAGRNMTGNTDAYRGTVMANTLKVVGIDLASAGEIDAEDELDSRVRNTDETYRKVVLDDGRIVGCIMLGDTAGFQRVTRMMKEGAEVSSKQVEDILAGA
jgi:nitrite reductase (NADH) large subunit